MRKTTFLIGTILVALNVQPLHADKTSREKICQEKYGAKVETVEEFCEIERKWLRDHPWSENTEEQKERIKRRDYLEYTLKRLLKDAHDKCKSFGYKYVSVYHQDIVKEYNEFFGLSEDD